MASFMPLYDAIGANNSLESLYLRIPGNKHFQRWRMYQPIDSLDRRNGYKRKLLWSSHYQETSVYCLCRTVFNGTILSVNLVRDSISFDRKLKYITA